MSLTNQSVACGKLFLKRANQIILYGQEEKMVNFRNILFRSPTVIWFPRYGLSKLEFHWKLEENVCLKNSSPRWSTAALKTCMRVIQDLTQSNWHSKNAELPWKPCWNDSKYGPEERIFTITDYHEMQKKMFYFVFCSHQRMTMLSHQSSI